MWPGLKPLIELCVYSIASLILPKLLAEEQQVSNSGVYKENLRHHKLFISFVNLLLIFKIQIKLTLNFLSWIYSTLYAWNDTNHLAFLPHRWSALTFSVASLQYWLNTQWHTVSAFSFNFYGFYSMSKHHLYESTRYEFSIGHFIARSPL